MAKKVQSDAAKAAYGSRFSQQDLTVKEENQNPQILVTPQSQEGGVEMLAELARGRNVEFASSKRSKTPSKDDKKVA